MNEFAIAATIYLQTGIYRFLLPKIKCYQAKICAN